jgi:hypothetical protein
MFPISTSSSSNPYLLAIDPAFRPKLVHINAIKTDRHPITRLTWIASIPQSGWRWA